VSGFEVPAGEPSAVRAAAGRLRRLAHDVDSAGRDLAGEQRGLAAGWRSDAGRAATAEVGVLGRQAVGFGARVAAGAVALDRYAAALEHAQGVARSLAVRDVGADTQARREAGRVPALPPDAWEDIYRREYAALRRPLDTTYRSALADLDHAARTCRAALESAVPGYHRGMSPTRIALAARRASIVHLPTVRAADQTRQGREDAATVAAALAAGRRPDPELLDSIQTNALDESYSAAFATTLGAAGLARLPAQVGRLDADDPTRRVLMTAVGAITGRATNGTAPDLPPDQVDDLVTRAGSTARSDPPHEARDYWSVLELVSYGRGTFAPATLARIATTSYDHRGALRSAQQTANPDQHEITPAEATRRLDDPMLAILGELAATPAAGRIFFDLHAADGELDRISTLMHEYLGKGRGDEDIVVNAVAQAAIDFPPGQRLGEDGKRGGEIASWFLHYAAADRAHNNGLPGATRDAVTKVLVNYYEDVSDSLVVHQTDGPGSRDEPYSYSRLPFQVGATISEADAEALLGEVWREPKLARRLLGAAALQAQSNLQAQLPPGRHSLDATKRITDNVFGVYGANVGRLLSAVYGDHMTKAESNSVMLAAGKLFFDLGTIALGAPAEGIKTVSFGIAQNIGDGLFDFGNPVAPARSSYIAAVGNQHEVARITIAEILMRTDNWPDKASRPDEWWDESTQHFKVPANERDARRFAEWLDGVAGLETQGPEVTFGQRLDDYAPPPP
jgi:uncharacterized protein YukE